MKAAARGYAETVRALLEKGGDVDAADRSGHTALMEAAFGGYTSTVQLLVEHGADLNAHDDDGWTALFWAAFSRRSETARLLLEKGADVNARNKQADTALIRAAYGGDADSVRVLLQHHPDVDAQDNLGRTALFEATREQREEVVSLLLQAGANVNLRDRDGETAISVAAKQHFSAISALLKEPAKPPNQVPTSEGVKALPDENHAENSIADPTAAVLQSWETKSEAPAFFRLGLYIRLLQEQLTSPREAESTAAKILGDLRAIRAPDDLSTLAQKSFAFLADPQEHREAPATPHIEELRKRLDEFALARADAAFFYAAGAFTYDLELFARHVTEEDSTDENFEEARRKLLDQATSFAAQCRMITECAGRAGSYFATAAAVLAKRSLTPGEVSACHKLAQQLTVALGTE